MSLVNSLATGGRQLQKSSAPAVVIEKVVDFLSMRVVVAPNPASPPGPLRVTEGTAASSFPRHQAAAVSEEKP